MAGVVMSCFIGWTAAFINGKVRGAKSGIRVIDAYIPENDEIYLIKYTQKAKWKMKTGKELRN